MTPDRPLITCVVPTFNAGRWLREALDSILGQTYRPLEIVVADDGSEDDTVGVAASYGEPVRVVGQVGQGPSATRNLGIRAARGAFVAFLDPDDLWHREKLDRQMRAFEDDPALDLCVSHVELFWEAAAAADAERLKDQARARGPVPGFAGNALLARRSAFDRVGLFDPALWFADAVDWFLRAEEAGLKRALLPDVLAYHRMHASNLTRRRDAESRDEFLRVVKARSDRRRSRSDQGSGAEKPVADAPPEETFMDAGEGGGAEARPEGRVAEES